MKAKLWWMWCAGICAQMGSEHLSQDMMGKDDYILMVQHHWLPAWPWSVPIGLALLIMGSGALVREMARPDK
jgi:hypothetical protein